MNIILKNNNSKSLLLFKRTLGSKILGTNRNFSSSNNNGLSTEIEDLPIYFHRDLHTNKDIFLIGSIHVSKDSASKVQKFISDVKPDTVVLELCDKRYRKIRNDLLTQDISSYQAPPPGSTGSLNSLFENIKRAMQSGSFSPTMIYDMITKNFYNSFKMLGLLPGLEFYYAIKEADKLGSQIILGDVDSQDTLKKLVAAMGSEILPMAKGGGGNNEELNRLNELLGPLTSKLTQNGGVTEKELEVEFKKILNNKVLKEIRSIFESELPITYEAMLIGRERNIVREIKQSKGNTIVTVVGALHVEGVKQLLNLPLDKIPPALPPPSTNSLSPLMGLFGGGGSPFGGGNGGSPFSGMSGLNLGNLMNNFPKLK